MNFINIKQAKVIVAVHESELDALIDKARLDPARKDVYLCRLIRGGLRKAERATGITLSADERINTALYLLEA